MVLGTVSDRDPDARIFKARLSRIDWKESFRDLRGSLTWSGKGGGAVSGNNMASAADVVAKTFEEESEDTSDQPVVDRYGPPPPSRYDPEHLLVLGDLTDLNLDLANEDESESDTENEREGSGDVARKKSNKKILCRQAFSIIALVAMVAGGVWSLGVDSSRNDESNASSVQNQQREQQRLLEMAEQIVSACSDSKLDEDISACQNACHGHMCCFEDESETEYSCREDETKECAVHAGCKVLIGSGEIVKEGGML